jgi:hypothetical protein
MGGKKEFVENSSGNRLLLIMVIVLVLVFSLPFFINKKPNELFQGVASEDFCRMKCGSSDYVTSNNNTKFNFVRCVCAENVGMANNRYGSASLKTFEIYFDSFSEVELTRDDVDSRINP